MKIIKSEKRLCTCCMEEHEVKIVLIDEQSTFKKSKVNYESICMYCDVADEWYADALSYKLRGYAITGLVYQALPMGAVPIGHDSIIDLHGVPCEEVDMGETTAYHFALQESPSFTFLSREDVHILNSVIEKLGKMTKNEIIEFMHKEKAYTDTKFKDIIQFKYSESLQL